jgi:hypothetical protein
VLSVDRCWWKSGALAPHQTQMEMRASAPALPPHTGRVKPDVEVGFYARVRTRDFHVVGGQVLVEERRFSAASNAKGNAGFSPGDAAHTYCRNPIQFSDTTSEFPGFCGSYFTEV